MTLHYADDWLTIHGGDCREVLRELPAESVHCVVTSPPYWGLRDYGTAGQLGLEPTPEEYVAAMVDVFREVRRVLRNDGTLWLNLGSSYLASGGERTYGSYDGATGRGPGTRRNRAAVGASDRNPSRQPERAPAYGSDGTLKPKDMVPIPWMVAMALQADGWYLRSDIVWAKPNPMPESVTDRPTKSHEYVFLLAKSARYFFDADAVREASSDTGGNGNFAGRMGGARDTAISGGNGTVERPAYGTGHNIRSVWTIATAPYPGAHFATFPPKLVEPCVKAGCPVGGVVLDPFAGTGTVGMVAQSLSRRAVLIDLNPEYLRQCLARNAQAPLGLGA
jgi:DNA modification methylase